MQGIIEWRNRPMDQLQVFVRRQPMGYDGGMISLNEIWNIHWDSITGGVQKCLPVSYLMGLISYDTAIAADVKFSGMHNYDSGIKVCIIRKYTPKETWKNLIMEYGPSPDWGKRKGETYCTTRILQLLEAEANHIFTRGILRKTLYEEGYEVPRIRNAINNLSNDGRILLDGSSCSKNQKIRLPK